MAAQTLYAYLDSVPTFFLSSAADFSGVTPANSNQPITFPAGVNTITITVGGTNPVGFAFSGFSIIGVLAGSTPAAPLYSAAAEAELNAFSITISSSGITITDNNPNNTGVNLEYEYTIYCQRAVDGVPFADDPRIVNQTGGGG